MKTQNKSSIITGVLLLVISALFSVSLLLQPFDFGVMGPGKNNVFYSLGKMLYTVYGFSSILIPVFLMIAGLSCFSTKWTARKTMCLLTALVPFFTCVITENICRSILSYSGSSFSVLKLIVTLVTGAMLMVIEFLGTGILADKIQSRYFENPEKTKLPRMKISSSQMPVSSEKKDEAEDINEEDINEEIEITESETKINPIFDDVFENEEQNAENVSEENEAEGEELHNNSAMITQEEFAALTSPEQEEENETEENDELVWNLPPQPESLPPEYDEDFDVDEKALEFPPKDEVYLNFEDENNSETQQQESENQQERENQQDDEIVEEYFDTLDTDSFDEYADDKDFDSQIEQNYDEGNALEEEILSAKNPLAQENAEKNVQENQAQKNAQPEEKINEYNYFNINKEKQNLQNNQKKPYNQNDPYAAANYMENIVKNPQFPYGIVLEDDSEEKPEESKDDAEVPRSKFPIKINLDQDFSEENFDKNDENFNDYESDDTLSFPDFNIEEPAIVQHEKMQQYYAESSGKQGHNQQDISVQRDEDFDDGFDDDFSPSINLEKENVEASDAEGEDNLGELEDISLPEEDKNVHVALISQAAQQSLMDKKLPSYNEKIIPSASDVFEDMEAEIRKDYLAKQSALAQEKNEDEIADNVVFENDDLQEEETAVNEEEVLEVDFNGNKINKSADISLDADSARNLTADELTDFFNVQQEENKPKGTEIQANPVQIGNRATKKGPYVIPSDLLIAYKDDEYWVIDEATKNASLTLKQTLAEFNIEANIIGIKKGPVVTMFEILPAPGVKLRKIVDLQDNIALNLAAQSVRIVAPIPGKQAVGIEVPNRHRSVVGFREIIEMNLPEWKKMAVPVILGKDILGKAQLIDLVKTPHMLIAGATGSGKSVCVNSLILSILYKRSFRDVKLILVDPKVVELKLYNNIPHLLTPVITEPKKALQALKWALCEMERRYALLDQLAVRDISTYNQRIKEQQICTEKLPYIVIIIDEFADLMATSGKELETVIARLTAMSRAVGIHLVLATQRPSVNVITGLIKANIPTRIAFMVASRTDSNIIIDTSGAEKLLGRGDMLYASAVDPAPIRIQGTFVTDQEVEDVVRTVKEYGEPDYIDDEIFFDDEEDDSQKDLFGEPMADDDPLYDQALDIVIQAGKASASYIQRKLKIGYNRAARLVEEMEERGIVGPANGSKPREIIHIP